LINCVLGRVPSRRKKLREGGRRDVWHEKKKAEGDTSRGDQFGRVPKSCGKNAKRNPRWYITRENEQSGIAQREQKKKLGGRGIKNSSHNAFGGAFRFTVKIPWGRSFASEKTKNELKGRQNSES